MNNASAAVKPACGSSNNGALVSIMTTSALVHRSKPIWTLKTESCVSTEETFWGVQGLDSLSTTTGVHGQLHTCAQIC